MSRTGALSTAELELVEVEVELLPSPVDVDDRSAVELLDPPAEVATDPTPLEKPVAAGPPPQATMASRATAEMEARMRESA